MDSLAYLLVTVDGVAKYWNSIYNPPGFAYPLPPWGISPVSLYTNVWYVNIVQDFPTRIKEGTMFEQALSV
jgi:hypothetical protein